MQRPRLLIFASGSAEGGGSGFQNLFEKSKDGVLEADIVGVVSNHLHRGVRERADRLGVPFIHFPAPWTAEKYLKQVQATRAEFSALSGWLKLATGLDPSTTFNIHPVPLPEFGGKGMYGHHAHEAVMAAYRRGEITHSAVCMHFVTSTYDRGPLFFRFNIKIQEDDTPESLATRVNHWEHHWQPIVTNLVVQREIHWSGIDGESVQYPSTYEPVQWDK